MRQLLFSKIFLASILIFVWAGATAYAFWWFEFKNLRPFDTKENGQVVEISADALELSLLKLTKADKQNIRVIHFWNPECYCNRFNQQHLEQIRQQYAKQGISFYLALVGNTEKYQSQIEEKHINIPILRVDNIVGLIPSTPSAAIIKAGHGLTYFGPYSEGAMCSAQSGSFVEKILDATLQGNPAAQINSLTFGCYCDLQSI
ncbi:MAG: DUF6436 domain-containing protein [Gammaproteobacteria bacterium]|nr:DUF6436 domain-containing protein [Gammaproteobacteria bacterium]